MATQSVKNIKALHAGPPQDGFQAWNLNDFSEFDLNTSLKLWDCRQLWILFQWHFMIKIWEEKINQMAEFFIVVQFNEQPWFSFTQQLFQNNVHWSWLWPLTVCEPTRQRKLSARCLILDCWSRSVRNGAAAEVRTAPRLELAMHLFCQMNPRRMQPEVLLTGSASAWHTITFRLMAAQDPSINARGFEARWRVAG